MGVEKFEPGKWYRFVREPRICDEKHCTYNMNKLFEEFGYKPWRCLSHGLTYISVDKVEGFNKVCNLSNIGGGDIIYLVEEVFPADDKLYDRVTNINQPGCATYLVKWETGALTTFTTDTQLTEYPSNAQQVWILDNPIYDKDVEKVKKGKLDKIAELESTIKESSEQIEQLKKEIM